MLRTVQVYAEPVRTVPRLPVELLEEIFTFTSLSAQISLGQVSREFNLLSTRLIYRDIAFTSPVSVVKCCQTLVAKPAAAAAVKSLIINFKSAPGFLFTSYYTLFGSALRRLFNIHDLELLVPNSCYLSVLGACAFPRLLRFECYLSLCTTLVSFLNRHPAINYLQLSPRDHTFSDINLLRPVILPVLEYFVGDNECLMGVLGNAALRAAIVSWEFGPADMEQCIEALQRSSSGSLKVLSCRRRGWNIDLMAVISTRLPDLLVLCINNVLITEAHMTESTREAFERYLPRFTSLERLLLHNIGLLGLAELEQCNMDRDFATVTAWGGACPSLVECTLPYSLKWTRVYSNIWWPDPSRPEGSRWLLEMINTRGYPEWGKLMDVIEERTAEGVRVGKLSAEERTTFQESLIRWRRIEELADGEKGEDDGEDEDEDEDEDDGEREGTGGEGGDQDQNEKIGPNDADGETRT